MADDFMRFRVAKDPVEQTKYYALKALPNGKEYFIQITHKNVSYWYMYLYYIILYDENGQKLVPEAIQRVSANSATFRLGDIDGELYCPMSEYGTTYGLDKLLNGKTSDYWLCQNVDIGMATDYSGFYFRFSKPISISKFELKFYYDNTYPYYSFYDFNIYCDNVLWGVYKSGNVVTLNTICDLNNPTGKFSLVKNSNKFNPNYIPKGTKFTIRPLRVGTYYNGIFYMRNLQFFDIDYNKIPITAITAVNDKKITFKLGEATCTATCELAPYDSNYPLKNIVEPISSSTTSKWYIAKNAASSLRTPKADIVLSFDREITFAGFRMCLGSTNTSTLTTPDTNPPSYYMSDFSLLMDDVEIYRKPNSDVEFLIDVNFKKLSDGVKRAALKRLNTPTI